MGSSNPKGFRRFVNSYTAMPRRMRFSVSLVGVIFLLVSTSLLAAAPVQAFSTHGPAYSYDSYRASSRTECLDVPNASTANGQYIQQWACNGNAQQEWVRRQTLPTHGGYLSNSKPFLYINNKTNKCLSILNNSNAAGAAVIQWNCDFSGNDLYELWFTNIASDCSYNGKTFHQTVNLGQFDSPGAPYRAFHASGGELSSGLHIYVNDIKDSSYCWYNPPLIIPAS